MSERLLDLRGLHCPWPALRVARALREGGSALVAIADDARAPGEIAAVAAAAGWRSAPHDTALGPGIRLWSEAGLSPPAVTSPLPAEHHTAP